MSKIYVTGFNGYLGSALCKHMFDKNFIKIGNPKKKYLQTDILKDLPNKVDSDAICLHLASISGEQSEKNKELTFETNVELTKRICDLNFNKIIFFSTSSVYGSSEKILKETDDVNPTNYYTETKILAENIIKQSKTNIILRMSNLMGISPNMNWNLFVNQLIKNIKKNKKIEIFNPYQYRPFLNISDAVNCLSNIIDERKVEGIFNFGFTDMNYNKTEILTTLKKIFKNFNYRTSFEGDKIYPSKPRDYKINCEKIKKFFQKKTGLLETFKQLNKINLN